MKDIVRYTLIFLISFFISLIALSYCFGEYKVYNSVNKQIGTVKEVNGEYKVYNDVGKQVGNIKGDKLYDSNMKQIGSIEKKGK